MSQPYDYRVMTHRVSVPCPACLKEAFFEFAEAVKIRERKDIPYFKTSKFFDYAREKNQYGGHLNYAYYYHGLHLQHGFPALSDLPSGYKMEDWAHPPYLLRSFIHNLGTLFCLHCGMRRKHGLDWPEEAYFQISYKEQVLWAYDRRCAGELMAYIQSTDRKRGSYKFKPFLLKVPAHFLTQKARAAVVKRLKAKVET